MGLKRKDFEKAASFLNEFLLKLSEDVECAELRDSLTLALLHMQKYYRILQCRSQEKNAYQANMLPLSARSLSPMTPFIDAPDKFLWKWTNLESTKLRNSMSYILPNIIQATKEGDIEKILEIVMQDGSTAVHKACYDSNCKALEFIIHQRGDIHCQDTQLRSPIHWAVATPSTDCLKLLLPLNVNVSSRDKDGLSPSMWACRLDHIDHFELLCKANQWQNDEEVETDDSGRTWLHWAVRRTEPLECLQTLLTKDSAALRDKEGKTVILVAAELGSYPACKLIVELAGQSVVHDQDNCERTALHLATLGGHGNVLNFLLENGANIEVRDQFQATAWDYASNKQLHYCQLIIKSHMHQSLQVGLRASNSNNLWQKNPGNRLNDQLLTINEQMHCNTNNNNNVNTITTTAITATTTSPIATTTTTTTTTNVGNVIKTNHQNTMRHDSRRSTECSSDEGGIENNNNNNNSQHVVMNNNNNNYSNTIRRGLRNRSASFQHRGESNVPSKLENERSPQSVICPPKKPRNQHFLTAGNIQQFNPHSSISPPLTNTDNVSDEIVRDEETASRLAMHHKDETRENQESLENKEQQPNRPDSPVLSNTNEEQESVTEELDLARNEDVSPDLMPTQWESESLKTSMSQPCPPPGSPTKQRYISASLHGQARNTLGANKENMVKNYNLTNEALNYPSTVQPPILDSQKSPQNSVLHSRSLFHRNQQPPSTPPPPPPPQMTIPFNSVAASFPAPLRNLKKESSFNNHSNKIRSDELADDSSAEQLVPRAKMAPVNVLHQKPPLRSALVARNNIPQPGMNSESNSNNNNNINKPWSPKHPPQRSITALNNSRKMMDPKGSQNIHGASISSLSKDFLQLNRSNSSNLTQNTGNTESCSLPSTLLPLANAPPLSQSQTLPKKHLRRKQELQKDSLSADSLIARGQGVMEPLSQPKSPGSGPAAAPGQLARSPLLVSNQSHTRPDHSENYNPQQAAVNSHTYSRFGSTSQKGNRILQSADNKFQDNKFVSEKHLQKLSDSSVPTTGKRVAPADSKHGINFSNSLVATSAQPAESDMDEGSTAKPSLNQPQEKKVKWLSSYPNSCAPAKKQQKLASPLAFNHGEPEIIESKPPLSQPRRTFRK
ncbi:probable serine/threonine-protein kinase nek3 isoform X2 [Octopus sinensis]|uniref:Probable serine/threonine-protein kinase nek3 isoform X2 n=1 Tax=Octopus sinensis TaxID=2607531 RepID=A0A7E6FN72_9MOLL|nr:probable serine/threonine-protein kinase nek3 isoform X2 [Octopus sinensis]